MQCVLLSFVGRAPGDLGRAQSTNRISSAVCPPSGTTDALRVPHRQMQLVSIRQGPRPIKFAYDRHDSLSVNTRNTGKLSQPNQPLNHPFG